MKSISAEKNGFAQQNLPKLVFSFFFLWVNSGFFFYSSGKYITSQYPQEWLGAIIGEVAFMWTMGIIFKSARTSRYLPIQSVLVIAGLFTSILYFNSVNQVPLVISIYLAVTWGLYIFWYSDFTPFERDPLKVGNKLPVFTLKGIDGQPVSSIDFIGKKALFLFYRGNWCPLCMTQIKELAGKYKELEERGVVVNLVSTQPEKFTRSLAKKHGLRFNFLIDEDAKVALALNIHQKNIVPLGMQILGHSLDGVTPTILITDKVGAIIFSEIADNYRIRPEPDTFLKVLDEHGN